ncbi:hypothetical protein SPRG_01656 [Saprolegnia parasitica CBS 223.65]|uniref:Secreted protein n=1 Tax=Saprolegnia parasitica (strain CBS 223.65) TaxID=695850 RepID=A0A067D506_SAPPC|nr:hypothetical protein SPRG_01656 [Saprolegnia parasitica CBS 223.65]KDO33776.1 hypothetical protein SPRG_01656 [Saprolegnia parasitica CBS 223.65]|eukprot:XP_012195413.1 hypothetical protein SPRG_01656 [Saprolegnia parasitica CBS 223.65]
MRRVLLASASGLLLVAAATATKPPKTPTPAPSHDKFWGSQDLWIYTSAWYPEQCSCMCASICYHPPPFLKTNLVTGRLYPIYKDNVPQLSRLEDKSAPILAQCTRKPALFSGDAIRAVKRERLVQYFPFDFSKDPANMWNPDAPAPMNVIPMYDVPCSGMLETDYLRTAVQMAQYIGTPRLITDNINGTVTKPALVAAFKKTKGLDVVLRCRDNALYEVFSCWTKNVPYPYQVDENDQSFAPAQPIKCPPAVVAQESSCGDVIRITKFVDRG